MSVEVITLETPGLGDRSYLVHDGTGAFVVDAQRDIDRVLDAAGQAGVEISHVFETHVHNDYVSGGLALCRRVAATLMAPADSGFSFDWSPLGDGDVVEVATMTVTSIETPGHTHSHLSYCVADAAGRVVAVFTGGSLLYGTVGRTDLISDAETDALTRSQWSSARRLVDQLPADTDVYPTHGFGSFCSAQAGSSRDSGTLADERTENIALTTDDIDEFVTELLAGLSDHPAYYAHMSLLNRGGVGEPDLGPPTPVDSDELHRRLDAGEWVLDLRDRRAFAQRHLVGSAGFEIDGPFLTYVGWLIPWGSRITLIADSASQISAAQRELVRIGVDRPAGAASGRLDELAPGHPTGSYEVATFADLTRALQKSETTISVVDVRRADEWHRGHLDGAYNLPIHQLLDHLHHVPDGRLWVHCASGARAAIAAGLLARAGHDVVLIDDDFEAANSSHRHAERPDEPGHVTGRSITRGRVGP